MSQILNLSDRYPEYATRCKPAHFEKNSPEWMLFADIYQITQNFWMPETENEYYWLDLINHINAFYEKYKHIGKLERFSKAIGVTILDFFEKESKLQADQDHRSI